MSTHILMHSHYVAYVHAFKGSPAGEKSRLQITDPKTQKVTVIDVSNIISVEPIIDLNIITVVLPNNAELKFKADSDNLFISWVATLKVAIGKGTYVSECKLCMFVTFY